MDPEALKNLTPQQQSEIMQQVQQQVALANMQVRVSMMDINMVTFMVLI